MKWLANLFKGTQKPLPGKDQNPTAQTRTPAKAPTPARARALPRGDMGNLRLNQSLLEAAESGNAQAVRDLLSQGASANAKNSKGLTPLYLAALKGHASVVTELISGQPYKHKGETDIPPFLVAVMGNEPAVIKVFVEAGANMEEPLTNGANALLAATLFGKTSSVKALIDCGANIEATLPDGRTALLVATDLHYVDMIHELMKAGADPEAQVDSISALQLAAVGGDPKVIEALVEEGADIEAKNGKTGFTALHFAAAKGSLKAAEALLKAGANVQTVAKDGRSPLEVASTSNNASAMTDLLLRYIKKPNSGAV